MRWALPALLIAAAVMVVDSPAKSHSWYSSSCCNTRDCQPWPRELIRLGPVGYEVYRPDGTHLWTFEYGSKKLKPSRDSDFHPCFAWLEYNLTPAERVERGTPLAAFCLYAPQAGA